MKKRRWRMWLISIIIFGIISIFLTDYIVTYSTRQQLFSDIAKLPNNKVGLLLGTSKYVGSGLVNLYYKYRIEAAVALYHAGKINFILVSGDNGTKGYNEPETMRDDLIAAGIPPEKIFLDYAGFRTLDSVVRCKEVFGEDNITIISQPFHNQRAVFIANRKDIHSVAYNAQQVPKAWSYKVMLREKLARVKMMLDIVFGTEPKFYGDKIPIQ